MHKSCPSWRSIDIAISPYVHMCMCQPCDCHVQTTLNPRIRTDVADSRPSHDDMRSEARFDFVESFASHNDDGTGIDDSKRVMRRP